MYPKRTFFGQGWGIRDSSWWGRRQVDSSFLFGVWPLFVKVLFTMLHVWRLIHALRFTGFRRGEIFLQHLCANKETLFALVSVHLFIRVTLQRRRYVCLCFWDRLSMQIHASRFDLWNKGALNCWTSFAWWNCRMTLAFMSVSVLLLSLFVINTAFFWARVTLLQIAGFLFSDSLFE